MIDVTWIIIDTELGTMELVYLANSTIPSQSAYSIHVMKMAQAISKNGHEVTLIAPHRQKKEIEIDNVHLYYDVDPCFKIQKVTHPNLSSLGSFLSNYLMSRKAIQLEPDLVYGRSVIGCYFTARGGLPTGYESHSPLTLYRFSKIQNWFFKQLTTHQNFRGLAVISDSLREYYETNYPYLADRTFVARDGADPVDESKEVANLDSDKNKLQVGYIGHLYKGRGMEVIGEMAKDCSWAEFHIIGGESEDVENWKVELNDLDNVTFYGFLSPSILDSYRLAFDVQLAPYQKNLETHGGYNTVDWMSPLKIFEYMATGRAIIASNLPAIEEILRHGETALLCDPENPDEWADSLTKLRNDDFREELGKRAKAEFLSNYTWEVRAEQILDEIT